jgi:hypothetical protein
VHKVADSSGVHYLRALFRFFGWCDDEGESVKELRTARDIDEAATWCCDHMAYEEQKGVSHGQHLKSGLTHVMPELAGQLPRTSRAVKSWEALEGNKEREPLGRTALAFVLRRMAGRQPIFAWCAWAQIDTLMREQDIARLKGGDVRVSEKPNGELEVSLLLGILERGESTKTGTMQGVLVQDPALKQFFKSRKEEVGDDGLVFPFPLKDYRAAFAEAMTEEGLAELLDDGSVHLFRHSGAALFVQEQGWSQGRLQLHGRWGSKKSVVTYGKKHLLVQNEARFSAEDKELAEWMWLDPVKRLNMEMPGMQLPPNRVSEIADTIVKEKDDEDRAKEEDVTAKALKIAVTSPEREAEKATPMEQPASAYPELPQLGEVKVSM